MEEAREEMGMMVGIRDVKGREEKTRERGKEEKEGEKMDKGGRGKLKI